MTRFGPKKSIRPFWSPEIPQRQILSLYCRLKLGMLDELAAWS